MNIQQFESKRQVVEAVQLTADAGWEAIAKWCGGEVVESTVIGRFVEVPWVDEIAVLDDWIVKDGEDFRVSLSGHFPADEFQPVSVLEGVAGDLEGLAGEIRQALEGVTPGPWKWVEDGGSMWLVGFDDADVLHGDEDRWVHMTQADGELIAAAPELLRLSLARIEQLEQIWLRDLASALDRLAAAQLAAAATTCIRCAAVLPDHEDDCTVALARSILGDAKEGA